MKIENLIVLENQLYNTSKSLDNFTIYIGNSPNIAFIGIHKGSLWIYCQYKDNTKVFFVRESEKDLENFRKVDDASFINNLTLQRYNDTHNDFVEKVNLQDLVLEYKELIDFRNGLSPNDGTLNTNYLI